MTIAIHTMPVNWFHCDNRVEGESKHVSRTKIFVWLAMTSADPLVPLTGFSISWQVMFTCCQPLASSYWRPLLARRLVPCKSALRLYLIKCVLSDIIIYHTRYAQHYSRIESTIVPQTICVMWRLAFLFVLERPQRWSVSKRRYYHYS